MKKTTVGPIASTGNCMTATLPVQMGMFLVTTLTLPFPVRRTASVLTMLLQSRSHDSV